MILPTKHLRAERSLLYVAGQIIPLAEGADTVSAVWDRYQQLSREAGSRVPTVSFDWFVLALDLLRSMEILELVDGQLRRTK